MAEENTLKDDSNSLSQKKLSEKNSYSLHRERIAKLQLFVSTISFAVSFVAQKHAASQGIHRPLTFTACRFIVSTSLLVLFRPLLQYLLHSKVELESSEGLPVSNASRELYKWGILCGIVLSIGSNLQQLGLQTVSASKTAFITGMYVIFVPIIEYILPGFASNLNWRVWVSAAISITGMYFLSLDSSTTNVEPAFSSGDFIVFGSMLCWSAAIMISGISTQRGCDSISYTIIQFMTATTINTSIALIFETNSFIYPFHDILKSWDMILLVGLCKGGSFLFGTLGQMYISPSKASLIMSLESVFAAIGAFLTLGEILSYTELFGCFLILSAAILCSLFADPKSSVVAMDLDDGDSITVVDSTDSMTDIEELYDKKSDDKMPFKIPTLASITGRESLQGYAAVNIDDTDDNCENKI